MVGEAVWLEVARVGVGAGAGAGAGAGKVNGAGHLTGGQVDRANLPLAAADHPQLLRVGVAVAHSCVHLTHSCIHDDHLALGYFLAVFCEVDAVGGNVTVGRRKEPVVDQK